MRIHKLQWARRTVQVGVLALTLAVPAVARYNNYVSAREIDKHLERWAGTLQGGALGAVDGVFRMLPGGEKERAGRTVRDRQRVLEYAQAVRGGPWSIALGPVSMTDPLAGAESIAASKEVVWVLAVSLLIPVLATVLLGRVFCSWICPMNLLLEFTDKLRGVLRFLELRPRDVKFSRSVKYVLLGLGLVSAAAISAPVLGYVYPPAVIGRELHDLVFGIFDRAEGGRFGFWAGGLTWMSLILLGIVLLELTVSRRWWCRYVCPGGALYSLLGWARLVRVKRAASRCTSCGACVVVCPMGLAPMQDVMGPECDNCGLCISSCNDDALNYTLWRGREVVEPPFEEAGDEKLRMGT